MVINSLINLSLQDAIEESLVLPARHPRTIEIKMEGETVLVHPRSGKLFVLNQTAKATWRHFDGHTTMGAASRAVARTFSTKTAATIDHVRQLAALFASEGLLAGSENAGT